MSATCGKPETPRAPTHLILLDQGRSMRIGIVENTSSILEHGPDGAVFVCAAATAARTRPEPPMTTSDDARSTFAGAWPNVAGPWTRPRAWRRTGPAPRSLETLPAFRRGRARGRLLGLPRRTAAEPGPGCGRRCAASDLRCRRSPARAQLHFAPWKLGDEVRAQPLRHPGAASPTRTCSTRRSWTLCWCRCWPSIATATASATAAVSTTPASPSCASARAPRARCWSESATLSRHCEAIEPAAVGRAARLSSPPTKNSSTATEMA